jgi:hypothetical protein
MSVYGLPLMMRIKEEGVEGAVRLGSSSKGRKNAGKGNTRFKITK